ncbi:MAG: glycosyl hydrolase-related protein [Candidatus Aminicenantes bacterium]|nr:glycosyl hydrolase-related protein [Candidatus Aminicenantes bacterium]
MIHRKTALYSLFLLLLLSSKPCLAAEPAAKPTFEVKPTVLFVEEKGALKQRLDVFIDNPGASAAATLEIKLSGRTVSFSLGMIPAGKTSVPVFIPEIKKADKAAFALKIGKETVRKDVLLELERKWTVYLLPHSHSDIGYTDLQTRVAKNHMDYLDSVIDFCRATNDYPDEAKFRWNIEISWSLQNYIRNRPAEKVQELFALIRSGRVELSALYLQLSDCFAHEELIRAVTYAKQLSRTNGFTLQCAMNNDVTGFSWALPQILNQVGVKYFTTGINEDRSRAPLRRPNPFYWQAQDGSKVLHWNGEHYLFSNYELLIHESYDKSLPKVTDYLSKLQARGDYPYDQIAFHISGYVTDNCPPKKELSDRVREWNSHWAYPKLRLATMSEFFTSFEKKFAAAIPTYKLGWPDYWTDGVASTAFETGVNRLAHNELLSAEKMAVAAGLADKDYIFPAKDIAEGYENTMLYDEHTWGASNSISDPESEFARSQWAIKSGFAYGAREIARTVLDRGLQALARTIAAPDAFALAVFNPLSWSRTDAVKAVLPGPLREKGGKFKLVDKRIGLEVPFQLVDKTTIQFVAEDVPAIGYALFSIVPDAVPAAAAPKTKVAGNVIENRFYKVTVDAVTGGISSLIDKETGQELVDLKSGYKLNQYVYENPEGGRSAVNDMTKPAKFVRHSPVSATAAAGLSGPVASSLIVKSKAKSCPDIQQEIVLYENLKRLDIIDRLKKEETTESEALYFAFPFNVAAGKFRFEIADGTMSPETEQLPGTTRDWQTVQHWVEIANAKQSVIWSPVEAPLVQFGEINTGKWLRKLDLRNTALFSYAMNNYWHTNFKAGQGGSFVFRYSISSRSGGADLLKSTRFGWEVHTPLVSAWLPVKAAGPTAAPAASFFSLDKPNVIIQAVKRADDGDGIVVRLRELAGIETQVKITSPLLKGELVTYIATDIGEGPANAATVVPSSIYVTVKPLEILTVRIRQ